MMKRLLILTVWVPFLLFAAATAFANRPLEEIREEIERNGWAFTVDHNWVYDLPAEARARMFGGRWMGARKALPELDLPALPAEALPGAWDWRDVSGQSFVAPVRNQGACGSCYAFSATGVAESLYMIGENLPGADVDLSESYLMFCLSQHYSGFYGCAGASYDYDEMDALVRYGTVDEACFPYDEGQTSECGAACATPALQVQLASWGRIPCNDVASIKTALYTYGPLDAAVYVTDAFQAYSGGVFNDLQTSCGTSPCYYTPTNHAIMLVGWDDADGAWILRNSWGSSWGEGGYMRIAYAAARVACEVLYATYEAPAPFQLLLPENGATASGAPTFYWTRGPYDAFRLYLYLPFYGTDGHVPVPMGWTRENFQQLPAAWWPWLRTFNWSAAYLLGIDSSTLAYEVDGPAYFMKIGP